MMSYRIIRFSRTTVAILLLFVFISANEAVRHSNKRLEGSSEKKILTKSHSRNWNKTQQIGKRGQRRQMTRSGSHEKFDRDYITVRTKNGNYRGKVFNILETRVAGFLGMRYGQSTAGKRRFRKPVPAGKWSGTRDATSYANSCFQWTDEYFGKGYPGTEMWNTNTEKSEDCLFLNVWTPLDDSFRGSRLKSSKRIYPVMVWIFGGGFYSGTSSLDVYQGQWLASSQKVVVVSMNYRVAAFGFLAFGIEEAPGNVGLWDQHLALLWIRDNIHHFQGDKDQITLFGESAGAASVSMHMLSEKSNTLFKNAILQSASVLSPWALLSKSKMKGRALQLAHELGCNDTALYPTLPDVVSCLTTKDAQKLADEEIAMADLGTARFQNAAIIDEDFLSEDVIKRVENGTFSTDINVLGGFNANEGNYFLVYSTEGFNISSDDPISYNQYNAGLNRGLWGYPWSPYNEHDQQRDGENSSDATLHAINFRYTDFEKTLSDSINSPNLSPDSDYKVILDQEVGDLNFVCPTIGFMEKTVSVTDTPDDVGSGGRIPNATRGRRYLYHFLHRSSQTPWPEWMGTLHGYEIEFAFGIPYNESLNYTDQEVDLSRKMVKYWANFAKTGNPNGNDGNVTLTPWPEYDGNAKPVMVLDIEVTNEQDGTTDAVSYVERNTKEKDCQFWNEYYPILWESSQSEEPTCNGSANGPSIPRYIYCALLTIQTLLLINV